jgi:hypothetical protein
MNAAEPQPAAPKPNARWFHLTPGRLLAVLPAVEGLLFLWEHFFRLPKGWPVLIAIAAAAMVMLMSFLWFAVALLFRWRFQFSIRSLLILTVAVAIPCSWLAVERKKAREQKEAVEAIVNAGGLVEYDDEDSDPFANLPATPRASGPAWLRNFLGRDFLASVVSVGLRANQVTNAELGQLKGMGRLQGLYLENTQVTDVGLEQVRCLGQLRRLDLNATRVTDAGLEHLKDLGQLQRLDLGYTQVTDVGLEHLKGLGQLHWLNLYETQVTNEGVKKLKRALPNCYINE